MSRILFYMKSLEEIKKTEGKTGHSGKSIYNNKAKVSVCGCMCVCVRTNTISPEVNYAVGVRAAPVAENSLAG